MSEKISSIGASAANAETEIASLIDVVSCMHPDVPFTSIVAYVFALHGRRLAEIGVNAKLTRDFIGYRLGERIEANAPGPELVDINQPACLPPPVPPMASEDIRDSFSLRREMRPSAELAVADAMAVSRIARRHLSYPTLAWLTLQAFQSRQERRKR